MTRRRNLSSDTFEVYFILFLAFLMAVLFLGTMGTGVYGLFLRTSAINRECGTDYNFLQVSSSGDTLLKLCQMKKQEITIKSKQ